MIGVYLAWFLVGGVVGAVGVSYLLRRTLAEIQRSLVEEQRLQLETARIREDAREHLDDARELLVNAKGALSTEIDVRRRALVEDAHFHPPEGYAPCTRPWPHDGPCAHPLALSSTTTTTTSASEEVCNKSLPPNPVSKTCLRRRGHDGNCSVYAFYDRVN